MAALLPLLVITCNYSSATLQFTTHTGLMNWDCIIHTTETSQIDLHNLQNMKLVYKHLQMLNVCREALNKTILNLSKSQNHSTKRGSPDTPSETGKAEFIWSDSGGIDSEKDPRLPFLQNMVTTNQPQPNTHQHTTTKPQVQSQPGHQGWAQVQTKRGLFLANNAFRNLPVCALHTPIPVLILQLTIGRKEGMIKENRKGIK